MADPKAISFTNIMGQGRVNQLGGVFINGRPLPQHIRLKIIEMASKGVKPCHISRQLRVSHGAVSKILNRYAETGSISPGQIGGNPRSRLTIQAVERHILALKAERPNICASELRACLIEQDICSKDNAPTVSSINRHIRSKRNNFIAPKREKKAKLNHSIENILGISLDESKFESPESSSSEEEGSREEEEGDAMNTRCRRNRTSFTAEQLELLEAAFRANTYPDQAERERIAAVTHLSEEKIMTWFSNRRARCRKNLAINPASQYIVQNIIPNQVTPMDPPQLVAMFPNPLGFYSNSSSPPSFKFHEHPILFYPQYPSL